MSWEALLAVLLSHDPVKCQRHRDLLPLDLLLLKEALMIWIAF